MRNRTKRATVSAILAVLLLVVGLLSGCQAGQVSRTGSKGQQEPSAGTEKPGATTENGPMREASGSSPRATAASTGYNGSATLQFEPFSPVDINQNSGFYDGSAGGVQFYYLPVQQLVWGYRVYLDFATSTGHEQWVNTNLWQKDPDDPTRRFRDFKAQYTRSGGTWRFVQPQPQSVVVDGLKAGNTYSYFITPLCVTAKAPFNLDRYGTPFTYGLVVGSTISFIWCEVNNKANWGAVQEPGGEANRGYYEVYNVISRGQFVARSSSGGGGGSGGGLYQ